MIRVKFTERLSGVTISGDYDDLNELVDALYAITIDEFADKHKEYIKMSTRILGLSYEIRHALQGDRAIETVDNGMTKDLMKYHKKMTSDRNVYYSCNYIFTEMIYCMAALNELIVLRARDISKWKTDAKCLMDRNVVLDKTITILRVLQGAFLNCMLERVPDYAQIRCINLMTRHDANIYNMLHQHMDFINIVYLEDIDRNKLKDIYYLTKSIVNYSNDIGYHELARDIRHSAEEEGCDVADIKFAVMAYPKKIAW